MENASNLGVCVAHIWTLLRNVVSVPPDSFIKATMFEQRRFSFGLLAALIVVWAVLLAIFHAFPELDLTVQQFFFTQRPCAQDQTAQAICGLFPASQIDFLVILRTVFFWLPPFVMVLLVVVLIASFRKADQAQSKDTRQSATLLLASWVICTGLIVNLLLKAHSGRPRPVNTDLFGGTDPFMAAGSFGGSCQSNCSFISGEAASAGWLLCVIPLLPPDYRRILALPIIAISLATPALRVAFGGHYLSDEMLGWLLSPIVFLALAGAWGKIIEQNQHSNDRHKQEDADKMQKSSPDM
jgi:membrane-associated phospholipid phosphatase